MSCQQTFGLYTQKQSNYNAWCVMTDLKEDQKVSETVIWSRPGVMSVCTCVCVCILT